VAARCEFVGQAGLCILVEQESDLHEGSLQVSWASDDVWVFPTVLDSVTSLLFDLTHLLGMVVVVRKRTVDVRDREVVPVGDRLGVETAPFDTLFDEQDRDPCPFDVRFVVNLTDDPGGLLGHLPLSSP
jgi:hypothetical protein